jgi:hypothetical protein
MEPDERKSLLRNVVLFVRIASFVPFGVWVLFYLLLWPTIRRDELCPAAYEGDSARVRLLVVTGADPSQVGWEYHFTPLGMALQGGRVEAARTLLALGADPNAPDDHRHTALACVGPDERRTAEQEQVAALIRAAGGIEWRTARLPERRAIVR